MEWVDSVVRMDGFYEDEGIYRAQTGPEGISYPEEGNDEYYRLEDRSYWFRHRNRVITAAIDRFPPPQKRLLDVGGGNGCTTAWLQKAGYQVALMEPGHHGCLNARARGAQWVFCGLCGAQSVYPESADAIGLFDVLEHIEDDAAFLREMRGLLKPGGMVYATVPAHMGLWSAEDDRNGHYRRYDLDGFGGLFAGAGYNVQFATGFFSLLIPPIWLVRHLPYKLGGGKKQDGREKQLEQEFVAPGPLDGAVMGVLAFEEKWMRAGKPLKTGASLFVAAQKTPE